MEGVIIIGSDGNGLEQLVDSIVNSSQGILSGQPKNEPSNLDKNDKERLTRLILTGTEYYYSDPVVYAESIKKIVEFVQTL